MDRFWQDTHRECNSCRLRTSDALGQWDCPQPFRAVVLHPLTRKGGCTFLKWFMAVLHACFVGCCFLAGSLIVARFSPLIWSISSNPVGSSTLVYCSSDVPWDPLSAHTAEVQRYLSWLFKSTFIGQNLRCALSLNPCAAFHYTELSRVCHLSKILGQTVSAVCNLRELLI